jgi:two-component system response regulator MprA
VKPFDHEELLARVRALLRRRPEPAVEQLTYAGVRVDTATREAWRDGAPLPLTQLEFDLLCHFLRSPRRVYGRQQLLDAVWAGGTAATSNVVDVYVGYLRAKLEAGGAPRLLHTVRGVGYALREQP